MKRKKTDFVDDGRVIAPMDVDGMPKRRDENRKRSYDVTKNEKKHLILASYKAFLPMFICGIIGMGLTILLIYLWLN
ncbi:MAG: hypothetical protein MR270_05550 [Erysipelotrichaceae bacterium]|nr:hypothetical protein [Erysipelotrichaceae bacterium]